MSKSKVDCSTNSGTVQKPTGISFATGNFCCWPLLLDLSVTTECGSNIVFNLIVRGKGTVFKNPVVDVGIVKFEILFF